MKAQVNVMLDTSIIELVEQKANELGISRVDAFRTAIAEWVGQTYEAKPVLKEKHYAYANGVSLGVFATKEEAEEAKRKAKAITRYFQVGKSGYEGIKFQAHFSEEPYVFTEDDAYHEYFRVELTAYSFHRRRFDEWDALAKTIECFNESERALAEVLNAAKELAEEHAGKGCVVSVVVA
jgi:hypothetical protein